MMVHSEAPKRAIFWSRMKESLLLSARPAGWQSSRHSGSAGAGMKPSLWRASQCGVLPCGNPIVFFCCSSGIASWQGSGESGWLAGGPTVHTLLESAAALLRVTAAVNACIAVTDADCVGGPHLYILPVRRRMDQLVNKLWLWAVIG
jgi:hypothetical protein